MKVYSVYYDTIVTRRATVTAESEAEAKYKFNRDIDCEYCDDYYETHSDYCEISDIEIEEGDDEDE